MLEGFDLDTLLIIGLIAIAAAGVGYALIYPMLSGTLRGEQRINALKKRAFTKTGQSARNAKRASVEDALRDIEQRKNNANSPTLSMKLAQAGLSITKERALMLCAGSALTAVMAGFIYDLSWMRLVMLAITFGYFVPRFVLGYLIKRRVNQFLDALPDAVDIIVRGVRAGLPLGDCLRIVATEAREPVRGEFLHIIRQQSLGVPLFDAIGSLYERNPMAETNFFGIVVSIQQKAGGNLSESLANLSKVLRERKKMKAKVQAMSQEAKSSAAIIGSLPIVVAGLVYMTTPDYISLLWTESLGQMFLAASAAWMLCGVLVMRQMINFDM